MKTRTYLPILDKDAIEDLFSKVEVRGPDECWPWTGYTDMGYGVWYRDGESWRPHRIVWIVKHGPIPDDLTIDHVRERGCETKLCCNTAHLEPVTLKENLARYHRSRKLDPSYDPTKCKRGHDREVGKPCWVCGAASVARSMAKKPEKYREMKRAQKQKERERQKLEGCLLDANGGIIKTRVVSDISYF